MYYSRKMVSSLWSYQKMVSLLANLLNFFSSQFGVDFCPLFRSLRLKVIWPPHTCFCLFFSLGQGIYVSRTLSKICSYSTCPRNAPCCARLCSMWKENIHHSSWLSPCLVYFLDFMTTWLRLNGHQHRTCYRIHFSMKYRICENNFTDYVRIVAWCSNWIIAVSNIIKTHVKVWYAWHVKFTVLQITVQNILTW